MYFWTSLLSTVHLNSLEGEHLEQQSVEEKWWSDEEAFVSQGVRPHSEVCGHERNDSTCGGFSYKELLFALQKRIPEQNRTEQNRKERKKERKSSHFHLQQ